MSFRGRYTSRFKRSVSKRQFFSNRGRSFKMRYQETGLSFKSRNFHNDPLHRRDYDKDRYHSKRGRGKDRQAIGGRYLRPPRSRFPRGRYMHHERKGRDRSPKRFQKRGHEGSVERPQTTHPHEWSNQEQFCVLSEAEGSHYSGSLIDWLGSNDGEFLDQEEYLEKRSRSPIIRERFDTFSLQGSYEKTFDRRSISPLVIQRRFENNVSNNHRRFCERRKSPSRRSRSFERISRRSMSFEERCQSRLGGSDSFRGNDYLSELERSPTPVHRPRSHERRSSVSNDTRRRFSPISGPRKDRSSSRRSRRSKRSLDKFSLSSIEREIQYEKRRFQMLQHQKKFHEKRSESSIERFLDDCKRSIEKKSKSSEKGYCWQKKHDRSLSPERHRRFKGLDKITIERGRSFEKSPQPHNLIEGRSELFVDRSQSNINKQLLDKQNIRNSNLELSPIFQAGSFDHGKYSEYHLRKSPSNDSQLELSSISQLENFESREVLKDNKIPLQNKFELSPISQPGSFEKNEFSQTNNRLDLSPISQAESVGRRKSHKNQENFEKRMELSSVSESGIIVKSTFSKDHCPSADLRLSLSPISQPGSFERVEFSKKDYRSFKELSNLSSISQDGSFEKQKDDCIIDRPNSTDSMQQFLAELEESCERSRSSSARSRSPSPGYRNSITGSTYQEHNRCEDSTNKHFENGYDEYFGGYKRVYEHDNKQASVQKSPKTTFLGKDPYYERSDDLSSGFEQNKKTSQNDAGYERIIKQMGVSDMRNEPFNAYSHQFPDPSIFNSNKTAFLDKQNPPNVKQFNYNEQGEFHSGTINKAASLPNRLETSNQSIQSPDQIADKFGIQSTNAPTPQFHHMSWGFNQNSQFLYVSKEQHQNSDLIGRLFNQFSSGKSENIQNMEACQRLTQNQEFQVMISQKSYSIPSFERSNQFELQNQFCGRPNSNILNQELYQRRNQNVQHKTVPYDKQNFQHTDLSNQGHFERFFPETSNKPNTFLDRPIHFPFTHKGPEKYSDMALNNQFSEVQNISASHHTSEINESHQSQQSSVFGGHDRLVQNVSYEQGFNRVDSFELFCGPERFNQDISSEERSARGQYGQWAAQGVSNNQSQISNAPIDIKHYLNTTFGSRAPTLLRKNKQNLEEMVNSNIQLENQQNNSNNHFRNVLPDPFMLERYRDCPPSPEVLGKVLKGFVIYFGVKSNSDLEKDPFVVIQESFSKSDRFGSLEVEEREYQEFQCDPKQICVLRWQGMMLVHAEGATREEARHNAAISLINSLAHTCYTVQTKYSYYCGGKLPLFMLREKEKPGIYKIISRDELIKSVTDQLKLLRGQGLYVGRGVDATNIQVALNVLDEFFTKNSSSHCELLFGAKDNSQYSLFEHKQIFSHADKSPELQVRSVRGFGRGVYSAVSRSFTPQQLCSYLLEYGQDHLRYRLIPPQGPQIRLLLPDAQYSPDIIRSVFRTVETAPPHTQSQVQPFLRSGSFRGRGYRGNAKRGI